MLLCDEVQRLTESESVSVDSTLGSLCSIEDLLRCIQEAEKESEHFRNLKKHRTKTLDDKIKDIEVKCELYRKIIFNTMSKLEPNQKTMNFPGVGKVTKRKSADSWKVEDEDSLIRFLEQEKIKDDIVSTSISFDHRKLSNALTALEKQNKTAVGAVKTPGKEGVSITFEKENVVKDNIIPSVPISSQKLQDLAL